MASRIHPVLLAFACLVVIAPQALGDPTTYVVTRSSRLRQGPSSTTTLIRKLDQDEVIEATSSPVTNGFRFVSTDTGENGWVWTHNIELAAEEEAVGTGVPAAAVASTISSAWDKPAPNHSTF